MYGLTYKDRPRGHMRPRLGERESAPKGGWHSKICFDPQ